MNERRTVTAYVARMRELTKSVTERNAKIHYRVLDTNGNQRTERSRRPRSSA
jgi:hypothetical protein